jgi:serine/threonine protein kinase
LFSPLIDSNDYYIVYISLLLLHTPCLDEWTAGSPSQHKPQTSANIIAMDCFKDKFVEGQMLDGRFMTIAPLNHGSFGMVFLAKDTATGEDVAIKCLSKSSSDDLAI